ncbi:MAG: hypothetical protein ABI855_07850 [Bacteroidota bacterium]
MRLRFHIEDMRIMAQQLGGKCLSKEYIDYYHPLTWMCERGHTWDTSYFNISQGRWCLQCARLEHKQDRLEEIKNLAAQRGGKCLSHIYTDYKTHLDFQCAKGHQWHTSPVVFLKGSWCPKCAGKTAPDFDELHQLAKSRGGKFLSKKYLGNSSPLKWQCAKGHKWSAAYSNVKYSETWCPHCYGNVTKTIDDIRQSAKLKGGKCLSETYINNRQLLTFQCGKGHIWKATGHSITAARSTWCPYCTGKMKHTIKDMQVLAKKRNGRCLSAKYFDKKTKLIWQCDKKHIWLTTPDNIIAGCWCPKCAKDKKRVRQAN